MKQTSRYLWLGTSFLLLFSVNGFAKQSQSTSGTSTNEPAKATSATSTVVLSGVATTARIADPNERVVFSGFVMRMADFVAVTSLSNAAEQHLRNQEMHNRETTPPTAPSQHPN